MSALKDRDPTTYFLTMAWCNLMVALASVWLACWLPPRWTPAAVVQAVVFAIIAMVFATRTI